MNRLLHSAALLTLISFATADLAAGESAPATVKTEHFDRDPGWEGINNRVVPEKRMQVKQEFGYSPTHFAGKAAGEMGGVIQRSTTPASYAASIKPLTLDDRFSASGSFAATVATPGAGVFFGFFNSDQPGGSGRPIGSIGLNLDFERHGARLAVRLITGTNKSCGTFITPFIPGKFRPTPLKLDGTRYHWTLDYDPAGAGGQGQFKFTLTSDTHTMEDYSPPNAAAQEEARRRFPNTTQFTVDVTPGYKREGATFDRFGVINMMKSGGSATIYFDDLTFAGEREDFSRDPAWLGVGNRARFEERDQAGAHDFGFSPKTNYAGGQPGEIGGSLWRSGEFGYYADRVGPLDLTRHLEARGKVKLLTAGPDSDASLGWFSSGSKTIGAGDTRNFVGIHIGGPTRVGHYFIPKFASATGSVGKVEQGPVLVPSKTYDWSLVYDPAAEGGKGSIRVTLGDKSATLVLKPGQKAQGAELDRFGLFTTNIGGQMVKVYLDDVSYTK